MIDPRTALLGAAGLVLVVMVIFWPRLGLLARLRRSRYNNQRVLLEDALKHIYDREYKKRACSLESLSGALEISQEMAARLIDRLGKLGLVTIRENRIELTGEGRSYALKVIRTHRLWERYLADETGLPETEWHRTAERLEHTTTEAEAASLARHTGNPLYDPHGDPIPTVSGELPPSTGKLLSDLDISEHGVITHLEDEPEVIYAQLIAADLHPGMLVQMLDKNAERVVFAADGEETVLAPIVAANVTVLPVEEEPDEAGPYETLAELKPGESAEVVQLSRSCRGQQRRRLMDLGIVPGTRITAEFAAASGSPVAYQIRGATIALRRDQAEMIHIHRKEQKK